MYQDVLLTTLSLPLSLSFSLPPPTAITGTLEVGSSGSTIITVLGCMERFLCEGEGTDINWRFFGTRIDVTNTSTRHITVSFSLSHSLSWTFPHHTHTHTTPYHTPLLNFCLKCHLHLTLSHLSHGGLSLSLSLMEVSLSLPGFMWPEWTAEIIDQTYSSYYSSSQNIPLMQQFAYCLVLPAQWCVT